ncbi:sulfotransferase [Synechococcus sp. AH-551-G15]|nr:sulfotransferase [Synechococcus sp. AH-551-G15]
MPKFLGLGVQKGGTTTLQLLLEQHPQVWLPPKKELHYFSLHYARGAQWYSDCFVEAKAKQCCGEITPYYIFHPQAPQRIAELIPDARLIVLLRDPVERCLSQYFHSCRWGLETLGLEQALAAEEDRLLGAELMLAPVGATHRSHQEHSYLARSRYEEQLARYELLFPSVQMLVLRSEDLFKDGPSVWELVQNFLRLDVVPFPDGVAPANAGGGEASSVPVRVCQQLREQLAPTYLAIKERYGISW